MAEPPERSWDLDLPPTSGRDARNPAEALQEGANYAYLQRRFGDQFDLRRLDPYIERARWALGLIRPVDDPVTGLGRFFGAPVAPPTRIEAALVDVHGAIDTDALLVKAIWSDRVPPGTDYVDALVHAASLGGYELTHALVSARIVAECESADALGIDDVIPQMAAQAAELLHGDGTVSDLALEACAFVCIAGHHDLVPDGFAQRVAVSELEGGGWPFDPSDLTPHWHATMFGSVCALELEHGAGLPPTRLLTDPVDERAVTRTDGG